MLKQALNYLFDMSRDDFREFIDNFVGELTVNIYGEAYHNGKLVAKVEK